MALNSASSLSYLQLNLVWYLFKQLFFFQNARLVETPCVSKTRRALPCESGAHFLFLWEPFFSFH